MSLLHPFLILVWTGYSAELWTKVCGASVSNTKITDLVFAINAVIFAESLEVLVMVLEALHEQAKLSGLQVSWPKTKVQVFEGLLGKTVQSIHACGEDIDILVAWSITMMGHVNKSYGGLTWSKLLWTCSAQVSGVVITCADGQRFKYSSRW